MQERLASVLGAGRRHLVTVRKASDGQLGIEFHAGLGDVEQAFKDAAKSAPPSALLN